MCNMEKVDCDSETLENADHSKKGKAKKEILYLFLMYIGLYTVSFLILIVLIRMPLFRSINILMYRGVVMIIIAGIIASLLMALFMKWKKASWLSAKDVIFVFIISCCINMVFFTLFPVTVERSVSVFMLSLMDENSEIAYSEEQITAIFVDKYVDEYGAFEKRFEEQSITGTIEKNADGTYSITDKGRFFVKVFRLISDIFDTDKSLVHP